MYDAVGDQPDPGEVLEARRCRRPAGRCPAAVDRCELLRLLQVDASGSASHGRTPPGACRSGWRRMRDTGPRGERRNRNPDGGGDSRDRAADVAAVAGARPRDDRGRRRRRPVGRRRGPAAARGARAVPRRPRCDAAARRAVRARWTGDWPRRARSLGTARRRAGARRPRRRHRLGRARRRRAARRRSPVAAARRGGALLARGGGTARRGGRRCCVWAVAGHRPARRHRRRAGLGPGGRGRHRRRRARGRRPRRAAARRRASRLRPIAARPVPGGSGRRAPAAPAAPGAAAAEVRRGGLPSPHGRRASCSR